jgi:predicted nucleotidyltransferase
MAYVPAKVTALLQQLTAKLPMILGRNLVGIYAFGSVTNSAFNPKRSDIDVLVVTQRDLTDSQFRKLGAWLNEVAKSNSWATRLQLLCLVKSELLVMDSSCCLYQFGALTRGGSDGNAIIWLDFLRSGEVLFGPKPESFLPEMTSEILLEALKRELGYLREEIGKKAKSEWRDVPMYRAYSVLTVCRILYSFSKGTIVSKPTAAKWAIRQLPEWSTIIRPALAFNQTGREADIPLKRIEQFIMFAESQLQ